MAAWRGKPIDHRSLGREIGANYLVESKLHDGGEAIRLTVQLIDAATGSMLWSERFVRKTADVAATPVDFPVAVAAQLGDQFLQIQMVRAMTVPGPFSGWQHMLRAFAYGARAESQGAALEEARKAVAVAPDLGLAHAFLGRVLAGLVAAEGEILDDARKREIQSHIQRAMQLDGDNPTIITFLVAAYAGLGEGETCLRLARRAVELSPNSPTSYHMLGAAYLALGRTGDAIAAFTQQDRFKHFDTMRYIALTYLGMSYLLEGQPEEAEAAIDRALALQPDAFLTLKWKAIVAAHRGEDQAALAAVRRLRELAPTWSIDQHVRQIDHNPHLARKSVAAIATLRRLWNATGTEA
jgi:tetratricopeptide (TPR) repeat protein